MKKFVRKLKKSRIQKEEFENLQKVLEIPNVTLTKDTEVFSFYFFYIEIRFDGHQLFL